MQRCIKKAFWNTRSHLRVRLDLTSKSPLVSGALSLPFLTSDAVCGSVTLIRNFAKYLSHWNPLPFQPDQPLFVSRLNPSQAVECPCDPLPFPRFEELIYLPNFALQFPFRISEYIRFGLGPPVFLPEPRIFVLLDL